MDTASLIVVAVSTDWRMIPPDEQQRVDLVQTRSVNAVSSTDLAQAGIDSEEAREAASQSGLADLLIGDFVLPFEAVSVLLLAAVIGSLALVRERGV